jgi:hypothetical protein
LTADIFQLFKGKGGGGGKSEDGVASYPPDLTL